MYGFTRLCGSIGDRFIEDVDGIIYWEVMEIFEAIIVMINDSNDFSR
jgi:hypothetical protein